MAFPHGHGAVDQNLIGIVDDRKFAFGEFHEFVSRTRTVYDRLRQRAVALGIRIDPLVPAGGLELRAEDGGAVAASAFHDLEKVVRFLWRQTADKPLIEVSAEFPAYKRATRRLRYNGADLKSPCAILKLSGVGSQQIPKSPFRVKTWFVLISHRPRTGH